MKYHGIELEEITPEKWNGRTRNMLVWNPLDTRVSRETIIGYEEGTDDAFCWVDHYGKYWHHCAEIPEETHMTTENEEAIMKSLKQAYNTIDIQNKQIENNEKFSATAYDEIITLGLYYD